MTVVLSIVGEGVSLLVPEVVQLQKIRHNVHNSDIIAVDFTVIAFVSANLLKIWLSSKIRSEN